MKILIEHLMGINNNNNQLLCNLENPVLVNLTTQKIRALQIDTPKGYNTKRSQNEAKYYVLLTIKHNNFQIY